MKNIWLSLFLLVFISCGTYRINNTSDFISLNSLNELNGDYFGYSQITKKNDRSTNILNVFNFRKYTSDFINITFEEPNNLKIKYFIGPESHELILKGKVKKKFLEIYFSKEQFIIPFIMSFINIDRIRIGKNKEGELLIRKFYDNTGNILFFAAGGNAETPYTFIKSEDYKGLLPKNINGKWGYTDVNNKIIISPKYDFAYIFKYNNSALVKIDEKWGLINKSGEEITPIKYDCISPITNYKNELLAYMAFINNKIGLVDALGNETILVIYDEIKDPWNKIYKIRLGDKWGLAKEDKLIIPAIYSYISWYDIDNIEGYANAVRNNEEFFVDEEGYEYKKRKEIQNKGFLNFLEKTTISVPDKTTKRKIDFSEQFIE